MATPGWSRLQTEILNLYRQRHILKRQLSTLRTQITKNPNSLERTIVDSCHLCMVRREQLVDLEVQETCMFRNLFHKSFEHSCYECFLSRKEPPNFDVC